MSLCALFSLSSSLFFPLFSLSTTSHYFLLLSIGLDRIPRYKTIFITVEGARETRRKRKRERRSGIEAFRSQNKLSRHVWYGMVKCIVGEEGRVMTRAGNMSQQISRRIFPYYYTIYTYKEAQKYTLMTILRAAKKPLQWLPYYAHRRPRTNVTKAAP
jgi:hypothetical protein